MTATAKNLRVSAKKARLIVDGFKGKRAEQALQELALADQKATGFIGKVLGSAIANAKQNLDIPAEKLRIKEIRIDEGPTMKRFRAASKGAAHRILKRTSHIAIILEDNASSKS